MRCQKLYVVVEVHGDVLIHSTVERLPDSGYLD